MAGFLGIAWLCNAVVAICLRRCVVDLYSKAGADPFTVKWWWVMLPWVIVLVVSIEYWYRIVSNKTERSCPFPQRAYFAMGLLLAVVYFYLTFAPLSITISAVR